ncbi:hypothetical protein CRE_21760 [Caenorhabditis remanei]|uniref:Uncharacterized protein n=1 Tax=Caenorhabditis remanei TaxID=31234 RepID=E3MEP1_CAERE|nr:hypothetical protein CRE_21760 [Caenorhabditis remanei]
MNDFYVTLPSSAPNSQFKNTSSRYVTRLPEVLNLERDKYVVAATDIIYPYSFVNVVKPLNFWIHFKSKTPPAHITFPPAHYADLNQIIETLNGVKKTVRQKRNAIDAELVNVIDQAKRIKREAPKAIDNLGNIQSEPDPIQDGQTKHIDGLGNVSTIGTTTITKPTLGGKDAKPQKIDDLGNTQSIGTVKLPPVLEDGQPKLIDGLGNTHSIDTTIKQSPAVNVDQPKEIDDLGNTQAIGTKSSPIVNIENPKETKSTKPSATVTKQHPAVKDGQQIAEFGNTQHPEETKSTKPSATVTKQHPAVKDGQQIDEFGNTQSNNTPTNPLPARLGVNVTDAKTTGTTISKQPSIVNNEQSRQIDELGNVQPVDTIDKQPPATTVLQIIDGLGNIQNTLRNLNPTNGGLSDFQLLIEMQKENEENWKMYTELQLLMLESSPKAETIEAFKNLRAKIQTDALISARDFLEFVEQNGRVHVNFLQPDIAFVELDDRCAYFLGYTDTIVKESATAPNKVDFFGNVSTLYLYCDVVDPIIVGNTKSSLLSVIPCRGSYGEMIHHTVAYPRYLPLMNSTIDSIRVDLLSEFDEPIDFNWGSTIIVLHFKKLE